MTPTPTLLHSRHLPRSHRMPAPKLIGVASEASWYGLPYGVLVTAATWAAQGYRVLVVDAEPADLALTSLAHAQPQRGEDAPFVELLRDRGARLIR